MSVGIVGFALGLGVGVVLGALGVMAIGIRMCAHDVGAGHHDRSSRRD